MTYQPLRLHARDPQDLKVISSCVQDSLIHQGGMTYDPDQGVFSLVTNRFMWEEDPVDHEGDTLHKRTHAGLHFSHVDRVRHRSMDLKDPTKFHQLMMVHLEASNIIQLLFADMAQIQLEIQKVFCHLHDLSEPWYTHVRPSHDLPSPSPSGA